MLTCFSSMILSLPLTILCCPVHCLFPSPFAAVARWLRFFSFCFSLFCFYFCSITYRICGLGYGTQSEEVLLCIRYQFLIRISPPPPPPPPRPIKRSTPRVSKLVLDLFRKDGAPTFSSPVLHKSLYRPNRKYSDCHSDTP